MVVREGEIEECGFSKEKIKRENRNRKIENLIHQIFKQLKLEK